MDDDNTKKQQKIRLRFECIDGKGVFFYTINKPSLVSQWNNKIQYTHQSNEENCKYVITSIESHIEFSIYECNTKAFTLLVPFNDLEQVFNDIEKDLAC